MYYSSQSNESRDSSARYHNTSYFKFHGILFSSYLYMAPDERMVGRTTGRQDGRT